MAFLNYSLNMIIDHVCVDKLQFYCNSKIIATPSSPHHNNPTITIQASPWSTRTGNSRAVPVISDQHFIEVDARNNDDHHVLPDNLMCIILYIVDDRLLQAALQSRLLSDNLESFPGYEHYPPWLLQLLSLDQDTQVGMLKLVNQQVGIDV